MWNSLGFSAKVHTRNFFFPVQIMVCLSFVLFYFIFSLSLSLFWCILVVLKGVCYNVHLFQVFLQQMYFYSFILYAVFIYCWFLCFEVGYMNYWESLYLHKLVFIVLVVIKYTCPRTPDCLCSIVYLIHVLK